MRELYYKLDTKISNPPLDLTRVFTFPLNIDLDYKSISSFYTLSSCSSLSWLHLIFFKIFLVFSTQQLTVRGDCKNFAVLRGHKNAVLDLQWTPDGTQIISASPDRTLRAWDVEAGGKQIKKMAEHSSHVNSGCPSLRGPPLVVSGSDDGTAKLWDLRLRGAVQTLPDKYQVTAVGFSDAADKIYTGGLDNDVKVWDLRRNEVVMTLQGHGDMITGMQLSPDGSYLLTNGMDCTLRIWDMRPYAPQNHCVKIFVWHQHNFEKNLLKCAWAPDGGKVTAGSSNRMVYIWDTTSRRILYKLPGHNGSVNETAFHPNEPIIGSCSSDKQIYLGEL